MEFDTSKILAGIGSILLAISFIQPLILLIIGAVLLLIGLKGLSEAYGEKKIYDNSLYAVIIAIVGLVVAIAVLVVFYAGLIGAMFLGGMMHPGAALIGGGLGAIMGIILVLVVLWVFSIVAGIYFKKTMDLLKEKSGEKLFGTAGLLILIGVILMILIVGTIILLIAWILAAIAFFTLKPPAKQEAPQALPQIA
ncbi:MAG: DUF996 domain-containing protein [Desulfurococcus sp.]|nr:DUF996 domain-containing protein [Desulfurococcus sp.]